MKSFNLQLPPSNEGAAVAAAAAHIFLYQKKCFVLTYTFSCLGEF